tara:strand:+ start:343 stop:663 length:321 start_codon:yes stop_codon:yes gene_type:complete
MFSQEFKGHSPGAHKNEHSSTSYTFGPHHKRQGDYIFYSLDSRVVTADPDKIPVVFESTPAWVVADLMLSAHRGQPLTEAEKVLCSANVMSPGLHWLQKSLASFSK